MTNLEISRFIKRYGGSNINFFINNKKNNYCAASTHCFENKITKVKLYLIVLQKSLFRSKLMPKGYLKAILLHEIGHIKKDHFNELKRKGKSTAEFEAQLWALGTSLKYKLNLIRLFLIAIMLDWRDYERHKKRKKYYYGAYRKIYKLLGKRYIQKCQKHLNELMELAKKHIQNNP